MLIIYILSLRYEPDDDYFCYLLVLPHLFLDNGINQDRDRLILNII